MNSSQRKKFLFKENICYIYEGINEKKVNKADFTKDDYLVNIFRNSQVNIYKTKWCQD